MMMSTKWLMHGGEAIVQIYPGMVHGFSVFPKGSGMGSEEGMRDALTYIKERMRSI